MDQIERNRFGSFVEVGPPFRIKLRTRIAFLSQVFPGYALARAIGLIRGSKMSVDPAAKGTSDPVFGMQIYPHALGGFSRVRGSVEQNTEEFYSSVKRFALKLARSTVGLCRWLPLIRILLPRVFVFSDSPHSHRWAICIECCAGTNIQSHFQYSPHALCGPLG